MSLIPHRILSRAAKHRSITLSTLPHLQSASYTTSHQIPDAPQFISQLKSQYGSALSLADFSHHLTQWCATHNTTPQDALAALQGLVQQNLVQYDAFHPVLSELVQLGSPEESEERLSVDVFPGAASNRRTIEQLIARLTVVQEQLKQMGEVKEQLDQKAVQRIRNMIYLVCGYLSAQMAFLGRATWKDFGWDVMEPFCYFTSFTVIVASYMYFVAHSPGEYTYAHVSEQMLAKQRGKLYVKNGFDIALYERLLREQEQLRLRLEDESLIPLEELLGTYEKRTESQQV